LEGRPRAAAAVGTRDLLAQSWLQEGCRGAGSRGFPGCRLHRGASAIACGYEDVIDLDRLGHDPLMKVAVGRCPETGASLASGSTISRLENFWFRILRIGLHWTTQSGRGTPEAVIGLSSYYLLLGRVRVLMDFATSRAESIKRPTTGLKVLFFNVTTMTGHGRIGKSTGNSLRE